MNLASQRQTGSSYRDGMLFVHSTLTTALLKGCGDLERLIAYENYIDTG